jgi:hypothetical protein
MALRPSRRPAARRPVMVHRVPEPRREDDVLPVHRPGMPAYPSVLETAYRLGLADGALAAVFEEGPPDVAGRTCRGRGPAEFAEYLWADQPGPVPAGLEANAPAWYLAGLTDALRSP